MKRVIKKMIGHGIKKVKQKKYNCSPLDYYKPNKPLNCKI